MNRDAGRPDAGRGHRVFVDKQSPTAHKHLGGVALDVRQQAAELGFDRRTMELINVRVSQINRCVFCLDLHTRLLREAGETERRLAVLPAWRDSTVFSARERAVLALAESVTLVAGEHISDDDYAWVRAELTDDELSVVTWAAIAINAFNRVSISSRHPLPAERASS